MAQATYADNPLIWPDHSMPPYWDGLYELRMFFTSPDKAPWTSSYPAAVIKVTGNTWTLVQGGGSSCTDWEGCIRGVSPPSQVGDGCTQAAGKADPLCRHSEGEKQIEEWIDVPDHYASDIDVPDYYVSEYYVPDYHASEYYVPEKYSGRCRELDDDLRGRERLFSVCHWRHVGQERWLLRGCDRGRKHRGPGPRRVSRAVRAPASSTGGLRVSVRIGSFRNICLRKRPNSGMRKACALARRARGSPRTTTTCAVTTTSCRHWRCLRSRGAEPCPEPCPESSSRPGP